MSIDVIRGVLIGCVTIIMKKVINKICNRCEEETAREIKTDVKLMATPKPKRVQFRREL